MVVRHNHHNALSHQARYCLDAGHATVDRNQQAGARRQNMFHTGVT